jgi:Na+-driven multidrug efflux pump
MRNSILLSSALGLHVHMGHVKSTCAWHVLMCCIGGAYCCTFQSPYINMFTLYNSAVAEHVQQIMSVFFG